MRGALRMRSMSARRDGPSWGERAGRGSADDGLDLLEPRLAGFERLGDLRRLALVLGRLGLRELALELRDRGVELSGHAARATLDLRVALVPGCLVRLAHGA